MSQNTLEDAKEKVEKFLNNEDNVSQDCNTEVIPTTVGNNEYLCITCEWFGTDIIRSLEEMGFQLETFESGGKRSVYCEFSREMSRE